jgi:hypothetical protein
MDTHVTDLDADFGLKGKFEIVGKGYYWNLKMGCLCPGGSKYGSTPNEMCNDKKLSIDGNCVDVPNYKFNSIVDMPIVNGEKYCAFRDDNYQVMNILRPDADNKCTTLDPEMTKLCGTPTGDPKK